MREFDENFYKNKYGGQLEFSDLQKFSYRAVQILSTITQGRSLGVLTPEQLERVKMAECALTDLLEQHGDTFGNAHIQSETAGSVSVTYFSPQQSSLMASCISCAQIYLAGTGLLYRGVY